MILEFDISIAQNQTNRLAERFHVEVKKFVNHFDLQLFASGALKLDWLYNCWRDNHLYSPLLTMRIIEIKPTNDTND